VRPGTRWRVRGRVRVHAQARTLGASRAYRARARQRRHRAAGGARGEAGVAAPKGAPHVDLTPAIGPFGGGGGVATQLLRRRDRRWPCRVGDGLVVAPVPADRVVCRHESAQSCEHVGGRLHGAHAAAANDRGHGARGRTRQRGDAQEMRGVVRGPARERVATKVSVPRPPPRLLRAPSVGRRTASSAWPMHALSSVMPYSGMYRDQSGDAFCQAASRSGLRMEGRGRQRVCAAPRGMGVRST
jgi:hypothetical protein